MQHQKTRQVKPAPLERRTKKGDLSIGSAASNACVDAKFQVNWLNKRHPQSTQLCTLVSQVGHRLGNQYLHTAIGSRQPSDTQTSVQRQDEGSLYKPELMDLLSKADLVAYGEIVRLVDHMNHADAEKLLFGVVVYEVKTRDLQTLAGTFWGREILNFIYEKVRDSSYDNNIFRTKIEPVLTARESAPERPAQKADSENLERINRALSSDMDPNRGLYESFGLEFPVKLYRDGLEEDKNVYYHPNLSSLLENWDEKTGGAVVPRTLAYAGTQETASRFNYILLYIALGPSALEKSDEFLRSIMWHEFVHYRQFVNMRGGGRDWLTEPEAKILLEEAKPIQYMSARPQEKEVENPNMESQAVSTTLDQYFETLSDDELMSDLRYLAEVFASPRLTKEFKEEAIFKIRSPLWRGDSLAKDIKRHQRLLKLIERVDPENLKDLKKAIKDQMQRRISVEKQR